MLTLDPSIISIILLSALALFVVLQLVYHFTVFGKLLKKQPYELVEKNWQAVSIVIAARSEYDNLQKLIPALLAQNYPNFEIIIVDDASWDGTTGYLEELEKFQLNGKQVIKAVFITDEMKKNYQGKKLALSLGIKAASNDILLFTDADCMPSSNDWIKHMVLPYHGSQGYRNCSRLLPLQQRYFPDQPLLSYGQSLHRPLLFLICVGQRSIHGCREKSIL